MKVEVREAKFNEKEVEVLIVGEKMLAVPFYKGTLKKVSEKTYMGLPHDDIEKIIPSVMFLVGVTSLINLEDDNSVSLASAGNSYKFQLVNIYSTKNNKIEVL